jgi:hypothetical protein
MRSIRAWWFIAAFLTGMVLAMGVEELILSAHDNRLEFSTPVHFLSGQPLARLMNAAEVPFVIQTKLWSGKNKTLVRQAEDRFVVSFDLWQQDYSVVALQTSPRKSKTHLTAVAAEKWCMEQMTLDTGGLGLSGSDIIWTQLEIRAEDTPREGSLFGRGDIGESGISLTPLIEVFSRPARSQQPHWTFNRGPETLEHATHSGS